MKILFLSHKFYPVVGGIEVNSEILAKAFLKAGHEIRLMTWTVDPEQKIFPFTVIRNPSLRVLWREHRWADIVFENNPSLRLAWPGFFLRTPFVVALRTWINREEGKVAWQDKLKRSWLKRASAVIAVSDAVRRKCWPAAVVIGNPYRYELFRILPEVERSVDFVFLGRLVSDKGAAIAINALSELFTHKTGNGFFSFSLTIIGDGPELEPLRSQVASLGLQKNIEFKGQLKGEALVNCLNKHRFILVPSLWEEPFGNVALEGMACGCVPIVSDGGGLTDAVGNAGVSFERGNVASLVRCISRFIEDPSLEQKLQNAAPAHLAEHHPDKVSRRYLAVIEKVFNATT